MTDANTSSFEFIPFCYKEVVNPFDVVGFKGTEELGRPFRFEITAVSKDTNINIRDFLNGYAKLVIRTDGNVKSLILSGDVKPLIFNGVLAEVEVVEKKIDLVICKFLLVPEIWQLSLAKSTCFYAKKDQSILDVIECAFKRGFESKYDSIKTKINFDFLEKKCYTSISPDVKEESSLYRFTHRDYVLQYDESYLDFIHRWLEKEGIYYYIESDGEFNQEIIFVDTLSKIKNNNLKIDSVNKFRPKIKTLPRKVTLRGYNREKSGYSLEASADVDENGIGNIDIFGENFRNKDEGEWYARVFADILKLEANSFNINCNLVGVKAGTFLSYDNGGGEYFVTKVTHFGSQEEAIFSRYNTHVDEFLVGDTDNYKCDLKLIPYKSSVIYEFRSKKITPKPVISGNLIAFIYGVYSLSSDDLSRKQENNKNGLDSKYHLNDEGAINSVDSDGFYSVEFRSIDIVDTSDGKLSKCIKMRLATPYAGFDHGMHFPLVKDTEVLISFTNGDPDLPVIFSAINNSLSPSISTEKNYQDNIIQTKKGNKIILRDSLDKRGIVLAVASLDNSKHYDVVQNFSPGKDPSQSSSVDVVTGKKFSNFLGGSFSLSAGTSSSISASLSSSISLSSSMSLSAGISNSINLGSMGIKWNPKLFDSFEDTSISLGEGGKSFNYGKDTEVIETKKSFEIKTGAIDNSFDKQQLKVTENYLKLALQAELALDILFAAVFQKGPEVAKNNSINDVESIYKKEIDSSYFRYQQDLEKAQSVEEKYKAKEDWSLSCEAAAKVRRDELKKINDSFEVDNEWGVRLTRNAARLAIQGTSNLNMLGALKRYASKLKEHQEKVKAHKSRFTMDDEKVRIYQNLLSSNPDHVSNEFVMDKEKINISNNFYDGKNEIKNKIYIKGDVVGLNRNSGVSANYGMEIDSTGVGLLVLDGNQNIEQEFYLSSLKNSISIRNANYNINISRDKIFIGKKDGKSSVRISDGEIYFNSPIVNINDKLGGIFSKNGEVELSNGAIKIFT